MQRVIQYGRFVIVAGRLCHSGYGTQLYPLCSRPELDYKTLSYFVTPYFVFVAHVFRVEVFHLKEKCASQPIMIKTFQVKMRLSAEANHISTLGCISHVLVLMIIHYYETMSVSKYGSPNFVQ